MRVNENVIEIRDLEEGNFTEVGIRAHPLPPNSCPLPGPVEGVILHPSRQAQAATPSQTVNETCAAISINGNLGCLKS